MPEKDPLFLPYQIKEKEIHYDASLYLSYWRSGWKKLRANRLAMAALFCLIGLMLMAIVGPMLTPYTYYDTHLQLKNMKPCKMFWLGSDELGRDLFTRMWWGARISLSVGMVAAVLDIIVGVLYGAISGFIGGRVDELLMRFADILHSLPYLLLVILLMVILGPGIFTMIVCITITGWINMARLIRGQILQLKTTDFALAIKALGASRWRILLKHLIPNTLGSIVTMLTLTIPTAIFAEAFLSFLGLGVQAPIASLGTMAHDGLSALRYYPWRLFFPAGCICITMLCFNILGDALRDALDPRIHL
ncbi:MAG: ABC transporter permease [Chlamydiae bacterium]|nr:ABC transporter permease [Chlamydiota bacterium]